LDGRAFQSIRQFVSLAVQQNLQHPLDGRASDGGKKP
jgi:hypothetical protein